MTEEDQIQIACAQYIDFKYPWAPWCHIPNGGKRERKTYKDKHGISHSYCPEGEKLKKMGVKKDMPDILILVARRGYYGFLAEMKKEDGVLRLGQKTKLQEIAKQGYYCCACWGVDELVERVDWYFGEL